MNRPTLELSTAAKLVDPAGRLPPTVVAARLGITKTSYKRWDRAGSVTVYGADLIAKHLGVHPVNIWGAAYDEWVPSDADVAVGRARDRQRNR